MATQVQVSDETLGAGTRTWQLELAEERMTVRELIRSRVYQEVQDANLRRLNQHNLLITVADQHGAARPVDSLQPIDWAVHFERAQSAYEAGRFLLLVDSKQTESLDEVVELPQGSQVTFLKLIPLVGG